MALPALAGDVILNDRGSATLKNLVAAAGGANQALTSLQGTAKQTDAAIEGIGSIDPAKLGVGLNSVISQLDRLQAEITATQKELSGLGGTAITPAGVEAANQRLATLRTQFDAIRQSVVTAQGQVQSFAGSLTNANATPFQGVQQSLATVDSALDRTDQALTQTAAQLRALGTVNVTPQGIQQATAQLGTLQASVGATRQALVAAQTQAQQFGASFATLNNVDVGQAVGNDLAAIVARLRQLDQAITQARQDLGTLGTSQVSAGGVDTLASKLNAIRAEAQQVRGAVAGVQTQAQELGASLAGADAAPFQKVQQALSALDASLTRTDVEIDRAAASLRQLGSADNTPLTTQRAIQNLTASLQRLSAIDVTPRDLTNLAAQLQQVPRQAATAQQALANLGKTFVAPTGPGSDPARLQAIRQETNERELLAQRTFISARAAEQQITAAVAQEAQQRIAIDQRVTAAAEASTQQRIRAERQFASEANNIAFGKQGEQGIQVIDLDAIQQAIAAEKNLSAQVEASAAGRKAAAQAEGATRRTVAQQTAATVNQAEQQITAQHKAEAAKRTEDDRRESKQRQQAAFNPLSALTRVAGTLGIGLGVREIARQVDQLGELGTQANRAASGFKILSGGATEAETRLQAIIQASGQTVDRLTAVQIGTQAISLGLAKSADDFAKLTTAARAVALVSPVIDDVQSALSELGLASANLSFKRLDQLGLGAGEVKAKIKELQAANSELDDSQAFLAASVDLLISKYGGLLSSSEAAATGQELLKVRIREIQIQAGQFTTEKLDAFLRKLAVGIGGGGLADQIKTIQSLSAQIKGSFLGDIADAATEAGTQRTQRLDLLVNTFNQLRVAQAAGVAGADDFAAAFQEIVAVVVATNDVTDEQAIAIEQLAAKYGIATSAVVRFHTAVSQQAQAQGLDEIRKKIQEIQAGAALHQFLSPEAKAQLDEFKDILKLAEANANKGIPITIDPRVKGIVSGEIQAALPDTAIFNEVEQAEQKVIDAANRIKQAQSDAAASGEPLTLQRQRQLQAALDLAGAELQLAQAQEKAIAATDALTLAKASGDTAAQSRAEDELKQANNSLQAANARKALVGINQEVIAAEEALAKAQRTGNFDALQAASAAVQAANARQEQAQASLDAATGITQSASASENAADAYKTFADATALTNAELARLSGSGAGVPAAFSTIGLSADQLKEKLQELAAAINGIALSSLQQAAGNALQLLPLQGVTATVAKVKEFQGQMVALKKSFDAANEASIARGGGPLDPALYQTAITAVGDWQKAHVDAMEDAAKAADKSADKSASAWESNQKRIKKATDDALTSIVQGVVAPQDLTGLISGNEKFAGGQNKDLLDALLPPEADIAPQVGRLADVAVNGFNSKWFSNVKDLFPQEVLDQGERAIQQSAAKMVVDYKKGLNTFLTDVPTAANQVLEKITANQNQAGLIEQVKERVKSLADVSDIDLNKALGIDTTAQEIGQSVSTGVTNALANIPFDQLLAQLGTSLFGQESPLVQSFTNITPEQQTAVNQAMLASIVTAAGSTTAEVQKAATTNPLVAALTPTTEQTAGVTTAAQTTLDTAGEAMVTQAKDGNYGGRAIDTIIAAFEAKKDDLEKSGRKAADWLGKALTDRFKDSVPAQLLNTLVTELVPLMAAASANSTERTAGAGVQ